MKKTITLAAPIIALAALLSACEKDSELENAVEDTEQAMQELGDGFKDAADEVDGDSAAEDAVEDIEDAAEDLGDAVRESAEDAKKKANELVNGS